MNRFSFILALVLCVPMCANIQQTTQEQFSSIGTCVETANRVSEEEFYLKTERSWDNQNKQIFSKSTEWTLIDSMRISSILPAGQQIGTQFYSPNATYHDFSSFGALIAESITALNKAPNWLCYELRNILTQLSPEKQLVWAGLINSTQDPFVDEIAFCIAHSSVEYLSSDFALPELFTENAEVLYAIDSELSYVQIVDYGTSATDREFYSTTRYQKYNSAGDLVQMDVPRDIYYWYLVHPKLTDEIPAYIDPAIIENNSSHNNNISPPPTGVFWRSFLYEAQEENYPVLADTLRQIQTLFNHNGDTSDAIHAIGWWINNTMSFTSNSERPHQPVRIYRKHIGRCGEYADYTSAASRTALIPCTSILSMSTDHTWNEFWDEDWIMWEPVNGYINNPFVYENGWGKVFGSVFEIRSDGVLSSVTERYSEGLAHINICFTDENQTPIDGARVILAFYESGYRTDMIAFTDNEGVVSFPVGEGRDYYVRAETSFALYPANPGTYAALMTNAQDGEQYFYEFSFAGSLTPLSVSVVDPPVDPEDDYRVGITYTIPKYYISGRITWDDISSLGTYPKFYLEVLVPGNLNLLLTDADNVIFYQTMQICEAIQYNPHSTQGQLMFDIPAAQDWYLFLDNSHHHGNAQAIEGIALYYQYGSGNQEDLAPEIIKTFPNTPNPFSKSTTLHYYLNKKQPVEIKIYNLKGQHVKTLFDEPSSAGYQSLAWDGLSNAGSKLSSGVYIARMKTSGETVTQKMLLIR